MARGDGQGGGALELAGLGARDRGRGEVSDFGGGARGGGEEAGHCGGFGELSSRALTRQPTALTPSRIHQCILYHHPTQPFTELLSLVYTSPPAKSQITGLRYSTSGAHPACAPGASREGLERGAGRLGGALEVKVDRGMKVEPYVVAGGRGGRENAELITPPPSLLAYHRIRLRPAGGGPALDPTKPVVVGADGKIVPPAPEKRCALAAFFYLAHSSVCRPY